MLEYKCTESDLHVIAADIFDSKLKLTKAGLVFTYLQVSAEQCDSKIIYLALKKESL